MTRFELTPATRIALNLMVQLDVIDACTVLELGAECKTPRTLLDALTDIVAARQHERGPAFPFDAHRKQVIDALSAASVAERNAAAPL